MAGNGPILEAAAVVLDFAGTRALDHVSFTLGQGEVHAIAGEAGAGKSTLVKVLSGIHRPKSGVLRVAGQPVRLDSPRAAEQAGISTVHQDTGLVPQLSVARNLLLGREPRRRAGLIDVGRMNALATRAIAGFGLHIDVRRPLAAFGAAAQQLIAVARATSAGTPVLILDEPTSGLEPDEVERLFRVIAGLRAAGRSVLYVSHRLAEIDRLADRVTVLRDGRLVHSGPLAGLDRLRLVALMLGRRAIQPPSVSSKPGDTTSSHTSSKPGNTTSHTSSKPGNTTSHTSSKPGDTSNHAPTSMGAPPADDPPILEATGLTRRHVLANVSINLRPGEVVGLGGLHGAGRGETARAIAGVLPLDAGQITVSGIRLRPRSVTGAIRAGVGLLPRNRKAEGIIGTLSVRDNIVLAALPRLGRAGIVSEASLDRLARTFMNRLRIKATSPRQPAAELSGGTQQKVLLARWLATELRILMLDEPTRGIDVGAKADVRALIDDLAVDGLAVMLISSDVEELVDSCDRIVVLRDGAVVGHLSGPDITENNLMTVLAAG